MSPHRLVPSQKGYYLKGRDDIWAVVTILGLKLGVWVV